MRFVDTNVLLYSISSATQEVAKRRTAQSLLHAQDLAISVQVLQEFYVQATRAGARHRLTHAQAVTLMESWERFPVQEMTLPVVHGALLACERWGVSYWDAAIIEAARLLDCRTVLTEDLQHGQNFDGVRAVNPFR